jgi:hypothetical protein
MLTGAASRDASAWEASTASTSAFPTAAAAGAYGSQPELDSQVTLRDRPYDHSHAGICRVHVGQLIISSLAFNAFQNEGDLYSRYWCRYGCCWRNQSHGPLFTAQIIAITDTENPAFQLDFCHASRDQYHQELNNQPSGYCIKWA